MIAVKSSGYTALIPALIGAVISLLFIHTGLAVVFFLLPLGFIGFGWGPRTLWAGLGFAVIGNCLLTVISGFSVNMPFTDMIWDIIYFTATAAAFAWIILPPGHISYRIPGAYRLGLGALLCTLVFSGLFIKVTAEPSFNDSVKGQIQSIASLYMSGSTEEAQKAFLDSLDTDKIIELMKNIIIRGGALFSSIVILFVNRQLSAFLIRFFGAPRRANVFQGFHADSRVIWVLSISALLLLISSTFAWSIPGIVLWNIVVLCVMMYLAQGFGIAGFYMSKPGFPPFMRFIIPVVFVLLLFSPVVNAIMLGAIILLGIAENWIAFRTANIAVNNSGPPSTPQA